MIRGSGHMTAPCGYQVVKGYPNIVKVVKDRVHNCCHHVLRVSLVSRLAHGQELNKVLHNWHIMLHTHAHSYNAKLNYIIPHRLAELTKTTTDKKGRAAWTYHVYTSLLGS